MQENREELKGESEESYRKMKGTLKGNYRKIKRQNEEKVKENKGN